MSGKVINNISGNKYGNLMVIESVGYGKWLCKCDCGNEIITKKYNLTSGQAKSCGCLHRKIVGLRSTTHGLSKHPLYKTWHNMRSRCKNPNATKYELYGGKGIKVCSDWDNSFQAFYDWAINNGWQAGFTIDRIDGDNDYCPQNCRWVDYKIQANNTTQVHNITYDGKTMGIYAWAEYLGIDKKMLSSRILRGWDIERAFTTPNIKQNGYNFGEYMKYYKQKEGDFGAVTPISD